VIGELDPAKTVSRTCCHMIFLINEAFGRKYGTKGKIAIFVELRRTQRLA